MHKRNSISAVLLALFLTGHALPMEPPETAESFLARHHIQNSPAGLRGALSNPDREVRGVAAGILAEQKDIKSIPLIKTALDRERNPGVQITLADALAKLGDSSGRTWLTNECKKANVPPPYRMMSANQVLEEGSDDCLAPVLDMLGSNPDPDTSYQGMLYLRRSRTPPADSVARLKNKLEATLRSSSRVDRWHASRILALIGDSSSIGPLQRAIKKEADPDTRQTLEHDLQALKARLHLPA